MEIPAARTTTNRGKAIHAAEPDNHDIEVRLNILIRTNIEMAKEKAAFVESLEADVMANPLSAERAFSYFGLLLGSFPPFTLLIRFGTETDILRSGDVSIAALLLIANIVCGWTGYHVGKLVGRSIKELEALPWEPMLLTLPFIGLVWGLLTGGAGGFFLLILGTFFGAAIGGFIGLITFPIFVIVHRLMKRGESIEMKHFLPLAFGITFSVCGAILGI
ncbi:MAG: hypothetical protein WBD22_13100 [Pyrinomonadaceae bacterium]